MRIIRLTEENIKRIKAVDITPQGNLVRITGSNGEGKSSLLDGIFYALGGEKAIPAEPIRHGESKAFVRLDLGDVVVTRKFSEKGTTLTVENAAGARFPNPQTMLNTLIGAISFDPVAFATMNPSEQFEMLRKTVKLDVDIDELTRLNKIDYDARTDLNRTAKGYRTQAAAIVLPSDLPAAPVDVTALMDQIASAGTFNADIEKRRTNRANMAKLVTDKRQTAGVVESMRAAAIQKIENERLEETDRLLTRIAEAEAVIIEAQARITAARTKISKVNQDAESRITAKMSDDDEAIRTLRTQADELEKKLSGAAPLPDPVEIGDLRAKIDSAAETNRAIEARTRKVELERQAKEAEDAAETLTTAMEARDHAKAEAIINAKMPIEGLTFGEGFLKYNNVPLDQASDAERLRVSVSVAMAANPKLRVLRVKNGSLLDSKSIAALEEMLVENDFQCWLEYLSESGSVGIVIEDGTVKGAVDLEQKTVATSVVDQTAMEI